MNRSKRSLIAAGIAAAWRSSSRPGARHSGSREAITIIVPGRRGSTDQVTRVTAAEIEEALNQKS